MNKTWIITQEPGETPRRKGPLSETRDIENMLRELYANYPGIICILLTFPADEPHPQHGYEWLDMWGDRRKRHPREDKK